MVAPFLVATGAGLKTAAPVVGKAIGGIAGSGILGNLLGLGGTKESFTPPLLQNGQINAYHPMQNNYPSNMANISNQQNIYDYLRQ